MEEGDVVYCVSGEGGETVEGEAGAWGALRWTALLYMIHNIHIICISYNTCIIYSVSISVGTNCLSLESLSGHLSNTDDKLQRVSVFVWVCICVCLHFIYTYNR